MGHSTDRGAAVAAWIRAFPGLSYPPLQYYCSSSSAEVDIFLCAVHFMEHCWSTLMESLNVAVNKHRQKCFPQKRSSGHWWCWPRQCLAQCSNFLKMLWAEVSQLPGLEFMEMCTFCDAECFSTSWFPCILCSGFAINFFFFYLHLSALNWGREAAIVIVSEL